MEQGDDAPGGASEWARPRRPANGRARLPRNSPSSAGCIYRHGSQATGVEELAGVAGVAKRTLYKLFTSKDQLVAAYLERMGQDLATNERYLLRVDLPPRNDCSLCSAGLARPRLSAATLRTVEDITIAPGLFGGI